MSEGPKKKLDPDELNTVIDTLKEFSANTFPLEKRLEWDHQDHCPEQEVRALLGPDVGLHLVFIPEELGGMGAHPYDVYRVCEEFAKIDLGIATVLFAVSLGLDPIFVGGTPEQQEKWVGQVVEKGLLVAYAVTEPEAGSNVEALRTTAEPVPGPDGKPRAYKLNGAKQFISNGGIADLYTILAKTPGGPSFFVVERGTKGLTPGKKEDKHGIRLSNTTQVILEDAEVPAENLLGLQEGEGIKQSNKVFGYTRVMVAAFGLGAGRVVMEKAIAYAKERKQFGTPLCDLAGFTGKLIVPHAIRLEASQALIEEVVEGLMDPSKDLHVEGSIAKLFATETGNAAAEAAIQALGGYGYCREYEVEKIKRDARILTIYEGTSEIQQNIIGLFRLRTNVRSKGAFYEGIAKEMEALGAEVGGPAVAAAARTLGHAINAAFKLKLSRNQHVLFGLADSIVETETAAALCRRAAKGDDYLKAASRLWAAEASSACCQRILKLFRGSEAVNEETLSKLRELADEKTLLESHKSDLADMATIVKKLKA